MRRQLAISNAGWTCTPLELCNVDDSQNDQRFPSVRGPVGVCPIRCQQLAFASSQTSCPRKPVKSNSSSTSTEVASRFVASVKEMSFPPEVVDVARRSLADSIGVAIGGHAEPAAQFARQVALGWSTSGEAQILCGGRVAPVAAALVNATMGHSLDYDDTHASSAAHLSNPVWSVALALGLHTGAEERDILSAFIGGFEIGARLGRNGLGPALNIRGLHSTGVLGCLASAAAAGIVLNLDEDGIRNALGAAATQTGGLVASFGTMAKPLHAGKAAMNGVIAAELAAQGFVAAADVLEPAGPLVTALVQDRSVPVQVFNPHGDWELMQNAPKLYACCRLTHPVIESALDLSNQVKGREISGIRIWISPVTRCIAGKMAPETGLEGKFSAAYCAALGLTGHRGTVADFSDEKVLDPTLRALVQRTELLTDDTCDRSSAWIEVRLADDTSLKSGKSVAPGDPQNPMNWRQVKAKFEQLVEPVLGQGNTASLFDALQNFDVGSIKEYARLVGC